MGSPFIFSGNDAKSLKNNLDLNGNAKILSGSVDPTQTATNAPLGSMYLSTLTGQLYKKKDAGSSTNWEKLLGSQVSNIKNYIGFNNFENNATTGWSLAHSALTSLVPTSTATAGTAFDSTHGGTAANGNLSISAVSSGKLAGLYSGSLAASSATVAGDMLISQAYTIDLEDQAKVLAFKFYYSATSNASNANWSGTSANTLQVWIYDVTNGAWIQPAGCYNLVQSAGVGIAQGTFQTPSNMTQFQIALISVNASSGAFTVLVDDFYTGPQALAFGPAMGDWASLSATISNVPNSGSTIYYKRSGDTAHIRGFIPITGVATGAITINLPFTIDTTKINPSNGHIARYYDASADRHYFGEVEQSSTTSLNFYSVNYANASNGAAGLWNASAPVVPANSDSIEFYIDLPILGWSSNTVMSADSDTRVVAFRGYSSSTQSAATATVNIDTVVKDTHGVFNTSSHLYIVPSTGWYDLVGAVNQTNSTALAIGYSQNGSNTYVAAFPSTSDRATMSTLIYATAGDSLGLIFTSSGTPSLSSGNTNTWFAVSKRSGPAVVAASESIGATIYRNATQSQSTASLDKVLIDTVDNDSHGAFSSANNRYVAPAPGRYLVTAQVSWQANATGTRQSYVYINGVSKARCVLPPVTGGDITLTITKLFKLSAGDYVEIFAQQTSGGALNIEGGTEWTFLSVERIGN